MKKPTEAEQLLRDYASLQRELCEALFDHYPNDDARLLTDLPKHGNLPIGDMFWEFQQHGVGVCFTCIPCKEVVDVHAELVTHPSGFDAWRLIQYFESKGIESIVHDDTHFDATSEQSLKEMLQELCREGFLNLVHRERGIYSLS